MLLGMPACLGVWAECCRENQQAWSSEVWSLVSHSASSPMVLNLGLQFLHEMRTLSQMPFSVLISDSEYEYHVSS